MEIVGSHSEQLGGALMGTVLVAVACIIGGGVLYRFSKDNLGHRGAENASETDPRGNAWGCTRGCAEGEANQVHGRALGRENGVGRGLFII